MSANRIEMLFRARNGLGAGTPDLDALAADLGLATAGTAPRPAAPRPSGPPGPPPAALPKPPAPGGLAALDDASAAPRQPTRGLVHDRTLGRLVRLPMGRG